MDDSAYEQRAWNTGLITAMLWTAGLAVATGLALFVPYKADPRTAYQTTEMISRGPLTGFLRNLHHWLSAVMIILGLVTIIVGLFRGAYRKPGQWLWLSVIALFLVGLASQITGHFLPFDQQAVRTAVVETSIAGNAPVVGAAQANLMRGGSSVGPATLHLWYVAHAFVFSVLILALLIAISAMAKKLGLTLNKIGWIVVPLGIAIIAAGVLKAPLGKPGSVADYNDFGARPEWYILPLHSLLTLSQGINPKMAFVGTMVVPALAVLLLVLLPWLDRTGHAFWSKGLGTISALAIICLLGVGARDVAAPVGSQIPTTIAAGNTSGQKIDAATLALAKKTFDDQGCGDCHMLNGKGGKLGPDLTAEGTRHPEVDWQIKHLQNPSAVTPGSTMPKFGNLPPNQLNALAQYLVSLNGK